jgi:hypothetical protein
MTAYEEAKGLLRGRGLGLKIKRRPTRMEWSTISKALAKSIEIAAQYCLESRTMVTSLRTLKVAVTHP